MKYSNINSIQVRPIPFSIAKKLIVQHHYLHSLPGGTMLAFGIFCENSLKGAITFGAGPQNAFRLVNNALPENCLTLTRLWLSAQLPFNSESRIIGTCLKALKKNTHIKFLVTYADPSHGHVGTIYQATNWLYTGLSDAVSLMDIGDGIPRHSRSIGHAFGTRSIHYLMSSGISVKSITQSPKYRYIYFLDKAWISQLNISVLPYPKKEQT
jgi:hypothetical protein